MYLKNIYLYIYIYIFFPSKTFQTNPPVFLDMTKKFWKNVFISFTHERKKIPQICEKWKIHNLDEK